jgi:hypothetical protein
MRPPRSLSVFCLLVEICSGVGAHLVGLNCLNTCESPPSIPPHVVNHHVVNMNGRKQLGQGENILVVGQPKSGTKFW